MAHSRKTPNQLASRLFAPVLAVITASIFLGACADTSLTKRGVEMAQVPVSSNPSGKVFPGKFVWHDLVTPDVRAAGKFYEELFGWQIDYEGDYAVITHNGKQIAGILQVKPSDEGGGEGAWIPSISVSDVDDAATRLTDLGGEIINGPVDMSQRGRAALVKDTQGAYLVLLRARGGDPIEAEAEIGDWLWDEIWTFDPEDTEAFYAYVVGFDEIASEGDYEVFMSAGKARAGIRDLQNENQNPLWVPVVRVADLEATAKRVTALGGVVWISPGETPTKGEAALIADTTGALLLIQRWPSQAPEGEG